MGRRFFLLYFAAWALGAAVYAFVISIQQGVPVSGAVLSAATNIGAAALLGLGVWRLATRLEWERRRSAHFWITHAVAAALYSAGWAGFIVLTIRLYAPPEAWTTFAEGGLWWQLLMGLVVYGLVAVMAYASHAMRRLREQQARAARAEALRAQAELRALRAQLDPHFLFNTLHSITALVRSDPRAVEDALERFGALLRYVLEVNRAQRDEVPLAGELEFVRGYLALEGLRLDDRLRVVEEIDPDALDCAVLAFTLQPLVENAVRHGIAPRAAGGTIRLAARVDDDDLVLEVADDGPGADRDRALAADGLGLRAVGERLRVRYGDRAALDLVTAPGNGFVARVMQPIEAASLVRSPDSRVPIPGPPHSPVPIPLSPHDAPRPHRRG